jgi:hypothetical protein
VVVVVTVLEPGNNGGGPSPVKPPAGDHISALYATGAQAGGGPHVVVYDGATGAMKFSFYAYDPAFTGGVRVAAGDLDGDGFADLVTGPGPGGGPNVRAFSGATGGLMVSFFAYDPSLTVGVNVAAGDLNGDGRAEIITSAASGAPHVKAFDLGGGTLMSFFAFPLDSLNSSLVTSDPSKAASLGGASVAVANVTGDGPVDLVVGAGAGRPPEVRVFNGRTGGMVTDFFAFEQSFLGGVWVG